MLLLADVGNTHTVLGLWNGEKIVERWRIGTAHISTEDELMVHVNHFLEFVSRTFDQVDGFCIASVVPPVNDIFVYFTKKYLKRDPIFVKSENVTWIKWHVSTPQEMGADRVANVIAAKKEFQNNVVIVDFGTAITLDIFTNEYEGGSILVGPQTSLKALFSKAAKLPVVQEKIPPSAIGKDTSSNVQSGVILGTAFAIDGLVKAYEEELSKKFRVVSTGGQGKTFLKISKRIERYDPDLTLKGIAFYYEEMNKRESTFG